MSRMEEKQLLETRLLAARIRKDVLEMLLHRGYGHLGGSLSLAETMADLYANELHVSPGQTDNENRDMVVLSKGHAGPVLYSALAEKGFFDKELLFTLNDGGTLLPSHPDRTKTPGVDMTTGSLGQGTSTAAGLAMAKRLKHLDGDVFLIVGDGELNEGQCWEAFQFISHYKLNNCIVLIDHNKKQLDGYTKDIINPYDIAAKMSAFGFKTERICGHDIEAIHHAIESARNTKDQACCIVLDTIKGAGVPYFENMLANHSVKFSSDEVKEEARRAIQSCQNQISQMERMAA